MKTPTCPDCGTKLTCYCPACAGKRGGKATGPTKARTVTSEAARAAVNARWDKVRKAKAAKNR